MAIISWANHHTGWVSNHANGTANKIIALAESLGIVQQISQGKRNRKYIYKRYDDILAEGTEITI